MAGDIRENDQDVSKTDLNNNQNITSSTRRTINIGQLGVSPIIRAGVARSFVIQNRIEF